MKRRGATEVGSLDQTFFLSPMPVVEVVFTDLELLILDA